MLAADHPELVHSVIFFAAGGKVPPSPPAEQALRTIFNPAATDADMLEAMKYLVGDPREVLQHGTLSNLAVHLGRRAYRERRWITHRSRAPTQEMGVRVTLISLPGAGHLPVATEPKKAAKAVVSFLHSLPI